MGLKSRTSLMDTALEGYRGGNGTGDRCLQDYCVYRDNADTIAPVRVSAFSKEVVCR